MHSNNSLILDENLCFSFWSKANHQQKTNWQFLRNDPWSRAHYKVLSHKRSHPFCLIYWRNRCDFVELNGARITDFVSTFYKSWAEEFIRSISVKQSAAYFSFGFLCLSRSEKVNYLIIVCFSESFKMSKFISTSLSQACYRISWVLILSDGIHSSILEIRFLTSTDESGFRVYLAYQMLS